MNKFAQTVGIALLWMHLAMGATPGLFIFGDSLVDSGNNNYFRTASRSNFYPFGINFDTGLPTGRFTDGRLIPDYIASFLGLPFPPPYLERGNIQQGANFASGGSGLLNSTGTTIPLSRQVQYFQDARDDLIGQLGRKNASEFISKSIFYVTTGNNDFANNYYINRELQRNYTIDEFEDYLLSILRQELGALYNLGARKFVVCSVVALGCNPMSLFQYKIDEAGVCATVLDDAAKGYNAKLENLLKDQGPRMGPDSLPGTHFVFANLYGIMTSAIKNSSAYGFTNVNQPCCPFGSLYSNCYPFALTCTNASKHVFWDMFHPTGAFNMLASQELWNGDNTSVSPINIRQLSAK